jgi:hypothetical protein
MCNQGFMVARSIGYLEATAHAHCGMKANADGPFLVLEASFAE